MVPTYANDDEVKAGPGAGEVSPEAEGDPLEDHLDGEEDREHHVDDLQDEQELLVVLGQTLQTSLSSPLMARGLYYKTYYGRNLQIFVMS